ncbi:MAG: heparinase II/III family protein [Erythrobacter sp.]|nr:heparinase II/III family protein [Erythrobacter sp.]
MLQRKVDLYWQTLRYLRPVQIYGRLWFQIARPQPELSAPPRLRVPSGVWVSPAARRPSLTGPGTFFLLNAIGNLDNDGWINPARDRLWLYNQQYFDDLNAAAASERLDWHRALIADWIAHNAPGHGCGWEPYPTSLRIVNWVKWALAGYELSVEAIHSLAIQARWLMRRLEWHLLGNHLFANAKALIFAGLFFDGPEAKCWRDKGVAILLREVPEQILPDGGQFELSPMYHALAVEDVLDLINLTRRFEATISSQERCLAAMLSDRVVPMIDWLQVMCHPDGEIALFNDAAMGIAPTPTELLAYDDRLGLAAADKKEMTRWLVDFHPELSRLGG